MNDEQEQKELLYKTTDEGQGNFEYLFPIWKCECGWLNRFINSFFEMCENCKVDHTLDWDELIVNEKVKNRT